MSKKSTPTQSRVVLGIDPGFNRVGVAVLNEDKILFSDCIETSHKIPHEKRLLEIGRAVRVAIEKWRPTTLAIEKLFFNQNITNALKVSEARGVILYEAALASLEVYEYSPQEVKIAITGYGKANKAQLANMAGRLVKIAKKDKKMLDDEMDAIALCITHLATQKAI